MNAFKTTVGLGLLLLVVAGARASVTLTNLGVLPGGTSSFGWAVNGDGSAAAGFCFTSGGMEAFRWTSAEGLQALGALPGAPKG